MATPDAWIPSENSVFCKLNPRREQMLSTFRRAKKSGHRSMALEYTLVALLTASAALQVFVAVGVKAF
jgi:hypothetical protein